MASAADTSGSTSRRRRTPEEIRGRLLDAAAQAFAAAGYAGATTAAIAQRAAVTEAQLFRYYPTKADLFREAVFAPLAGHLARFTEQQGATGGRKADREQARAYIAELHDFLEQHAGLLRSLLSLPGADRATAIEALQRYFDRGAASWAARLGADASADPQLVVRISFAAVLGTVLFKDWLFEGAQPSVDALSEGMTDFVLNGIS